MRAFGAGASPTHTSLRVMKLAHQPDQDSNHTIYVPHACHLRSPLSRGENTVADSSFARLPTMMSIAQHAATPAMSSAAMAVPGLSTLNAWI